MPELPVSDIQHFVAEGYVPFANIERAIPWPDEDERSENDAEHSFSIALIGSSLGTQLGLDPAKIALYATIHDFPERYAGDTSVWDEAGLVTKVQREAEALETIKNKFYYAPSLHSSIEDYENLIDEEACFVYALDKLLAVVMIVNANGKFWLDNGITFEMHLGKVEQVIPKISKSPPVLAWYHELLTEIEQRKDELFAKEKTRD